MDNGLRKPLSMRPPTTDPAVASQWPAWTEARPEGLAFERLDVSYRPVGSWLKYKVRSPPRL